MKPKPDMKTECIAATRRMDAEALTRLLTAFPDFEAMRTAQGGYRPSLRRPGRGWFETAHNTLADLYDHAQQAYGDPRRAA